jgi:type I restriction enzyme M protein
MARILDPEPGQTVYDPCCGSGGLLIKAHLRLLDKYGEQKNGARRLPSKVAPLKLYGQDIGPEKFAMTRMNAVIHDMEAEVALGDTMTRPAFKNPDGSLRQFDLVTANPMWNQKFAASVYEGDTYNRFTRGVPPSSSADWGWVQHMFASLNKTSKMAIVLDTGAVGRGSGNQGSNKERDIRKRFVDDDLVEAVFLLPENMFYNTTAPGIIMVVNRKKKHKGEILLVNGTELFSKGRPKNFLEDKHIEAMADAYLKWKAVDSISTIIFTADTVKND